MQGVHALKTKSSCSITAGNIPTAPQNNENRLSTRGSRWDRSLPPLGGAERSCTRFRVRPAEITQDAQICGCKQFPKIVKQSGVGLATQNEMEQSPVFVILQFISCCRFPPRNPLPFCLAHATDHPHDYNFACIFACTAGPRPLRARGS